MIDIPGFVLLDGMAVNARYRMGTRGRAELIDRVHFWWKTRTNDTQ